MKYVYDFNEDILYSEERFIQENFTDTNTIKYDSIEDFVKKLYNEDYTIEYDEKFLDPYIKIGEKEIPLMESVSHRHEGFVKEKDWLKHRHKLHKK